MGKDLMPQEIVRSDGPNILMIMSDQHRADWMGCAGADWVHTPNIDILAGKGVRFTRAVCNSPLCAPSRSALASGLRCSSVGVLANRDLYPLKIPTYYQALRSAGYRVGCVGKTDLHKRDHWEGINGNRPIMYHLGFTDPFETEGKCSAARFTPPAVCPYTNYLVEHGLAQAFHDDYERRRPVWRGRDSILPLHAYHDDFVGRNACRFLGQVSEENPWHYFVSFVGPHDPWDAPSEYSRLYDPEDMPADAAIQDQWVNKPERLAAKAEKNSELTSQELAGAMRQYAGMITLVDDYVGRFMKILGDRGLLDNTLIIYTSDHGEMMGDHGLFGKSVYYESSLRVPLIIAGPGVEARGKCEALVHFADLMPTILEFAGVEWPSAIDSSSMGSLLRGEAKSLHDYLISELVGSRMLFDGRYKFVENDGDLNELYDLESDPYEVVNLAGEESGRAKQMRSKLHSLLDSGCALNQ